MKSVTFREIGLLAWILDSDGNKVEPWQPMLWDAAGLRVQVAWEEQHFVKHHGAASLA